MIANNRAGHRRPAPWTDHPRTWYTLERWRRLRRHQLNKQPVCEMCLERGLVRVATVADHIEDHRNWNEFLTGKLRSLCRECHEIRHGRLLVPTEIGEDGWPKQSGGGPQQSTTLAQVACAPRLLALRKFLTSPPAAFKTGCTVMREGIVRNPDQLDTDARAICN